MTAQTQPHTVVHPARTLPAKNPATRTTAIAGPARRNGAVTP